MEPSFLSLLPALVAIGLAFATRQVIPALFLGIVTGGVVLTFETGDLTQLNVLKTFFLPALGSTGFAKILLVYLWCLGGLIGMWEKTGGAIHFSEVVGARFAKSAKGSLTFAWLVGCIFHQGGTISTVLAGTTVKPVTDRHRIAHEELAYVVDSTASPIATVLPFNAWPGFIAALVAGTIPILPNVETATVFFFSSIKYNFYGMFAVLGTLLFSLGLLPWVGGTMKAARERARDKGQLDSDHARPMLVTKDPTIDATDNRADDYQPSLIDFFIPIGTLLGFAIIPYVVFDTDFINEAFVLCVLSAMVVARIRGMKMNAILDGFIDGCKSMTIGAIILGLAVTIGAVAKELHTADYLVTLIGSSFPAIVLPGILTLLCMGIAFSCGTSWGTYAVVFPVAMPLAWAVNPDPGFVSVCFGAVLGGAVFGDQCSPISDTTILSAMFTGCDLMDHVKTQLPLAMAAALIGASLSTLAVLL